MQQTKNPKATSDGSERVENLLSSINGEEDIYEDEQMIVLEEAGGQSMMGTTTAAVEQQMREKGY